MSRGRRLACVIAFAVLFAAGCGPKQAPSTPPPAPPPPPPRQHIFALLEDPEGKAGFVVVTNAGGTQELSEPYQAVRVERADVGPTSPFVLSADDVQRLFGSAGDVLPAPEVRFVLYFDEGRDALTPESEAQIGTILAAIQERRSTLISVTGHTDTTGNPKSNYELGLRRAQQVAGALRTRGVEESNLFIQSHGQADLLVKTAPGVAESRNRRVEVIVR